MEANKLAYFVARYRAFSQEELAEVAARGSELADEAASALQQVSKERGLSLPDPVHVSSAVPRDLCEAERGEKTKQASELWNSGLSRRVQFQFGALAIVFAGAFLGRQGINAGALWLVLFAAGLYYIASKAGRSYTRSVCADAESSLEEKRRTLRAASMLLWPALLIAAFLGVVLAGALRGT